ncbi:MAG: Fe-Mn family superoxide dismutase [Steroidobacteraceae bacterium]
MREFTLAPFGALSAASIKTHLELYKGYAEQTDAVQKQLVAPLAAQPPSVFTARETLARRLSFEGNGANLHELFFEQFEQPGKGEDPEFSSALQRRFGSFRKWQEDILELGKARGPGWVLTSYRAENASIENFWIDLHELGIPAGSAVLYVVDLWEHAYWLDYGPKGRDKYMGDLFQYSNWAIAARRYQQAQRRTT